ncbi:MAG: hypothetical protein ACN4EP_15115 [Sediminibacterium sp.]
MLEASIQDKGLVIDILTQSFIDNKSVNYIIPQDGRRVERIRKLMAYSFDVCKLYGEVFFCDDKKACAMIVYPERKRVSLMSVWFDIKFIFLSIGIFNISKAVKREAAIKEMHPPGLITYLWFIGVKPVEQHKGSGTSLLTEIINLNKKNGRVVCLETSTEENLSWYKKNGLEIYTEMDFGYKLYCLQSV